MMEFQTKIHDEWIKKGKRKKMTSPIEFKFSILYHYLHQLMHLFIFISKRKDYIASSVSSGGVSMQVNPSIVIL